MSMGSSGSTLPDRDDADAPAAWLAEGFAAHVASWGRRLGAEPAAVAAARLAALAVSQATSEGHVCVTLAEVAEAAELAPAELRKRLFASRLVGNESAPASLPMVLDGDGRLYLHRYFDYERRLAVRLRRAAAAPASEIGAAAKARLRALFPAAAAVDENEAPDWQMLAVALALRKRLTIVSGGPGTGKTTTLVALLACLEAAVPGCRVALAAPTGKAAARMSEAIRERAERLPAGVPPPLQRSASTIHRLLGPTGRPGAFRHHADNRLAIDALIVDEASMLDLALATRLLEAVPEHARIVLLGDKDQLAAVESGAVFSELGADSSLSEPCRQALSGATGIATARIEAPAARLAGPLRDSTVWLRRNYRFTAGSGIGRLAEAINRQQPAAVLAALRQPERSGAGGAAAWIDDEPAVAGEGRAVLGEASLAHLLRGYEPCFAAVRSRAGDAAAVLAAFASFRVLCAVREGPRGVRAINDVLAVHGRAAAGDGADGGSPWFAGRPVLVTRNDELLRLFNGDVGICLADAAGTPMVFFPDPAGSLRAVAPARLPAHETAYAMTVHKAQGSEFDDVLVVLPSRPSRVVTRELLYTAVTRARRQVTISASEEVLQAATQASTRRQSGLLARLREANGGGDTRAKEVARPPPPVQRDLF